MSSSSQNDDSQNQAVMWVVLIGAVLLATSVAVGTGLYRTLARADSAVQEAAAPQHAASATGTATVAATTGAGASVVVEGGVVKFYFASGSAALAQGANEALADVVKGVAEGRKAIISGYHDATGSAALNAELAKQRAFAVRDALLALGVGEAGIELRKPEQTLANTADDPQARRVEVTLE